MICLHGGGSGAGFPLHNSEKSIAFTHAAESNGFIVVFAQSMTDEISWNVWELYESSSEACYQDDVFYLDWLIDRICKKYSIDETRIYLHAHSFGDVMATEYALKRGYRLAAVSLCGGPANASNFTDSAGNLLFDKESQLPVLRVHGSEDLAAPSGKWPHVSERILMRCNPVKAVIDQHGGVTDAARKLKMELAQMPNILLWNQVNQWDGKIAFTLKENLNLAVYTGSQPFIYAFEEQGQHFLPICAAEYLWKYFFRAYVNEEGQHRKVQNTFWQDREALIFADGTDWMCRDNQKEKLDHPVITSGDDLMMSKNDAMHYFGTAARILDGNKESIILDGIEYLSLERCAKLSGLSAVSSRGVIYISDHSGKLSFDMTYLIRVYLESEQSMTAKDCYDLEQKELEKHGLSVPEYPR